MYWHGNPHQQCVCRGLFYQRHWHVRRGNLKFVHYFVKMHDFYRTFLKFSFPNYLGWRGGAPNEPGKGMGLRAPPSRKPTHLPTSSSCHVLRCGSDHPNLRWISLYLTSTSPSGQPFHPLNPVLTARWDRPITILIPGGYPFILHNWPTFPPFHPVLYCVVELNILIWGEYLFISPLLPTPSAFNALRRRTVDVGLWRER